MFSELGRLRDLKAKNPDLIIGVGGCVASQEGAAILKRAPYVDLVFGPQTIHRLGDMLEERKNVVNLLSISAFLKLKNLTVCLNHAQMAPCFCHHYGRLQ